MLTLLLPAALAAFPEDVSLRAMNEVASGAAVDAPFIRDGYQQLVQELGTTIANKPNLPAETLGFNGFAFSVSNSFSFTRTGTLDGTNPTGWNLADPDDDPPPFLFVPTFNFRKGLPASLELGGNLGWIGLSRTAKVGVFGRWGIVEGYRQFPDLTVQMGYSGYIGNDELELGVADVSATIGYSLPFGTSPGINQAKFSPFFGIGTHRIHAAPRVDLSNTALETVAVEVSGRSSDTEFYDKAYAPLQLGGGFRIQNGSFNATVSGAYSPGIIPTVDVGFGWVY